LRVALASSGRKGLMLTSYPDTPSQVSELCAAMGMPRYVFHLHCPSAIIRQTALDNEQEESEAEALANAHENRNVNVEQPIINRFQELGASVVDIETSTLVTAGVRLEDKLLEPFKPEVVVLLGSTGTGRGELATQLARHHRFFHVHTTTLFNEEIARGSALGRQIALAREAQRTVPLDAAIAVIKNEVIRSGCAHVLLDGFPRLVGDGFPLVHDQFAALEQQIGPIKGVVNLVVSDQVRADRVPTNLSPEELEQAHEVYQIQKRPVLEFARTLHNLALDIDADPAPDVVAESVVSALAQRDAEVAAEYRLLTMTAQDILNEKIQDVITLYGADQEHVESVEQYFTQFDMNGDGKLTFGEMVTKMQAWGIEKDPKEYMGMDFSDESVVTKDEWYRFIFKAVFLLDKVGEAVEAEGGEGEDGEEEDEE
jgi:adenylate kinase family enzyme